METKSKTITQLSMRVGYVFQSPDDQILRNEVLEEVTCGPENKGEAKRIEEITQWVMEFCGTSHYAQKNPCNIPYSIRGFLTIASVVALNSGIIILDESTAVKT